VKSTNAQPIFAGISLFPHRKGQQWYPTCGFKKVALIHGAVQQSYRPTIKLLNYSRHQEKGGTPLNTLRDVTETEGLKVLDFLTRKSENILKKQGFNSQGVPEVNCAAIEQISDPVYLKSEALQPALDAVCAEMEQKGLPAAAIEKVKKTVTDDKTYEQTAHSVYIHIDDVGVKEQKPHRDKKNVAQETTDSATDLLNKKHLFNQDDSEKPAHPTVQNTVARIEHAGKGFTLTGRSISEVLIFVLAFLLNNGLHQHQMKICTDGLRSLQNAILRFFSWHPHFGLLLDWFHLAKKFKEELSSACTGREIRNYHLKQLVTLLWFGLTEEATSYLAAMPATDLKAHKPIERLINYLERNRREIPCYAMRSQLKLPNSSNPVERCNHQVTARRQKHQGMSWSEKGSYALTALSAVTVNHATQEWVENRTLPFVLVSKAA
jgi:hypothetical protein